ncbi:MAG: hypothetical protein FWH06_05520, partial [Oscillospiraceae bacterium]|nr:hypothetical protein [Oscillospiraceae bacterium]
MSLRCRASRAKRFVCKLAALSTLITVFHAPGGMAAAGPPELSGIAEFSAADIYESPQAYDHARAFWGLREQIAALDGCLDKPEPLLGAFRLLSESNETFERLYAYAYLAYAADQRDAAVQERYRGLKNAAARFEAQMGGLLGQMTSLSERYLRECRSDKRFAAHTRMLDALIAGAGSEKGAAESLLREITPSLVFPAELAVIVLNADFNPPYVTRPDGDSVPATSSEMARALSSGDARYRRETYELYYGALGAHRNTLAAALEAHVSGRVRQASLRAYVGMESFER